MFLIDHFGFYVENGLIIINEIFTYQIFINFPHNKYSNSNQKENECKSLTNK